MLILGSGIILVLQVWFSVSMMCYAWRSWNDPLAKQPFLLALQNRIVRKLLGEEGYQARLANLRRQPLRRQFAAITFIVSLFLLLMAVLLLGGMAYDLLQGRGLG